MSVETMFILLVFCGPARNMEHVNITEFTFPSLSLIDLQVLLATYY